MNQPLAPLCLRFDPSRNLEKGAPLPDGTSTYFPFAMGPRSCQGQFYGELLVRAAFAVALRDHEFEAKGPVPPPAMLGFIHPMTEAWAKIEAPPVVEKKKSVVSWLRVFCALRSLGVSLKCCVPQDSLDFP